MKQLLLLVASLFFCATVWGQDAELVRKAEAGDIGAQGELALEYELNNQYGSAAKWAKPAAEAGDAVAQDVLASLYRYGRGGLPKDEKLAFKWAHKAANQGYDVAMFALGLWYEDTNKEEAIYWYKKCMDSNYQKRGEAYDLAAAELHDLGVYYHPGSSSSSTASSSRSSSSSSSSTRSGKSELLYSGLYTKSSQGYCVETGMYTDPLPNDFEVGVEIYDDHIVVLGSRYDYVNTSNGWKVFGGVSNFMGSTEYYKVNPNTFEMSYTMVSTFEFMGRTDISTFIYAMQKGKTQFQKAANSGYNGGTNQPKPKYTSPESETIEISCLSCGGSGKCKTCYGEHRYINPLTGNYVTCPNCKPDGRCSSCGGTGRKKKVIR